MSNDNDEDQISLSLSRRFWIKHPEKLQPRSKDIHQSLLALSFSLPLSFAFGHTHTHAYSHLSLGVCRDNKTDRQTHTHTHTHILINIIVTNHSQRISLRNNPQSSLIPGVLVPVPPFRLSVRVNAGAAKVVFSDAATESGCSSNDGPDVVLEIVRSELTLTSGGLVAERSNALGASVAYMPS